MSSRLTSLQEVCRNAVDKPLFHNNNKRINTCHVMHVLYSAAPMTLEHLVHVTSIFNVITSFLQQQKCVDG